MTGLTWCIIVLCVIVAERGEAGDEVVISSDSVSHREESINPSQNPSEKQVSVVAQGAQGANSSEPEDEDATAEDQNANEHLDLQVDELVGKIQPLVDTFHKMILEQVYTKNTGKDGLDRETQAWVGYRNVFSTFINAFMDRLVPDLMQIALKTEMSTQCMMSLSAMASAWRTQQSWAVKMFDSSGRPFSSGFIDGTITDFGSFDQCLDLKYHPSSDGPMETAQYCMVQYGILLPPKPPHLTLQTRLFNFTNTSVDGTVIQEISDLMHVVYERSGRVGICTPSACSKEDLQRMVSFFLDDGRLQANVTHCEVKAPLTLTSLQTAIAAVFGAIMLLSCFGTVLSIIYRYSEPKLPGFKASQTTSAKNISSQILLSFSIPENIESLLDAKRRPGSLDAINGIRVLSMAWIIWTHTYLIPIKETFAFARNYILAVEGFLFQFILNGWVLVDTFFCIGAMLAVYGHLNTMKRTGKLNLVEIMVNRFFRFSPSVWFTVALLFLMPALATGPLWGEYFSYQVEKCEKYWWASILFFNNWFPEAKICMLHTWYLSADIQLYLFSLLFLIPLYKWGKNALLLPYAAICIGISTVFLVTYVTGAAPTVIYNTPAEVITDGEALSIYTPTYIHLGPYCIGIVAGYLVYRRRNYKMPIVVCIAMWILALGGCLCILFYTYTWNIGHKWTPLSSASYASLHRTCWALCIAWITFACVTGNGGPINTFLSWTGFIPLGKLSFMMYLMHFPILWMRYAYLRERLPFGHYTMFCEFIVNIVLSFFAALYAHLLVEAPATRLYKVFISKRFSWAAINLRPPSKEFDDDKGLVLYRL